MPTHLTGAASPQEGVKLQRSPRSGGSGRGRSASPTTCPASLIPLRLRIPHERSLLARSARRKPTRTEAFICVHAHAYATPASAAPRSTGLCAATDSSRVASLGCLDHRFGACRYAGLRLTRLSFWRLRARASGGVTRRASSRDTGVRAASVDASSSVGVGAPATVGAGGRAVGRCLGGGHVDDNGPWARSNPRHTVAKGEGGAPCRFW